MNRPLNQLSPVRQIALILEAMMIDQFLYGQKINRPTKSRKERKLTKQKRKQKFAKFK